MRVSQNPVLEKATSQFNILIRGLSLLPLEPEEGNFSL